MAKVRIMQPVRRWKVLEAVHVAATDVNLDIVMVKAKAHTGTTRKSLLGLINEVARSKLRKYVGTSVALYPFQYLPVDFST